MDSRGLGCVSLPEEFQWWNDEVLIGLQLSDHIYFKIYIYIFVKCVGFSFLNQQNSNVLRYIAIMKLLTNNHK